MREIHKTFGTRSSDVPEVITGENEATKLVIDVQDLHAAYPDALYSVVIRRSDGLTYPASIGISPDASGHITYTLKRRDVYLDDGVRKGGIEVEFQAKQGVHVVKDWTLVLTILRSVSCSADPLETEPSYLDHVIAETGENKFQAQAAAQQTGADREAVAVMRGEVETLHGLTQEAKGEATSQADRSKAEADRAEGEADDAAQSALVAGNSILNGVNTHNNAPAAHPVILAEVQRVEAIARGRATAYVFDTYQQMVNWLGMPANVTGLVTGDNLYIRDTGVKDYWWDGSAPQELEAEAPDLADYYTKTQVDARLPIYLSESDYAALVASGTTEAGRVYYPIPDEYWEGS